MTERKPHGQVLADLLRANFFPGMVVVEIGCGASTLGIREALPSDQHWEFYCVDIDQQKLGEIERAFDPRAASKSRAEFFGEDSIRAIPKILNRCSRIDLLFLDGMGNALRCFREFAQLEGHVAHDGAMVLIDNAVRAHEYNILARKGRVLVPYLEAHPRWQVEARPDWGDLMIMATRRNDSRNYMPEQFGMHSEDWPDTLASELKSGRE